jgi:hypothetical protein
MHDRYQFGCNAVLRLALPSVSCHLLQYLLTQSVYFPTAKLVFLWYRGDTKRMLLSGSVLTNINGKLF